MARTFNGEIRDNLIVGSGAMHNALFLVMNSAALDFQTVWGQILERAPNCRILRNANVRVVVGSPENRSVDHLIASTIIDRKHGIDFTVKASQYVVAAGGTASAPPLRCSVAHTVGRAPA